MRHTTRALAMVGLTLALGACHGPGDNGLAGQAGAREATLAHGANGATRGATGGGPRGGLQAGQEPRGLNYATAARGNGHAADVPEATLREMNEHSAHPQVDEPGPRDNARGQRPPHSAGVLRRDDGAPPAHEGEVAPGTGAPTGNTTGSGPSTTAQ